MANLEVSLNGTALPIVKAENLIELTIPNESDNVTLDGSLYTDFVGLRRGWEISWPRLKDTDYNTIKAIFDNQYSTSSYVLLSIPYYGIYHMAKLEISNKNIKWDGCYIIDFSITLKEQYSVS
jgi:hypothetical protein